VLACEDLDDRILMDRVPEQVLEEAKEGMELARAGYSDFDAEVYQSGYMTPVYFGSALKNYGVHSILDFIASHAPEPKPSPSDLREVAPGEKSVSGFVFKVQANMDRNHRDRVAFLRLCSGHFQRGMKLKQVRSGKDVMIHSPIFFFAQDREIVEEAGPGDVIGIPNHGTIRVGDTFTEGENFRFTGLPVFAPEILRRVRLGDTTRIKQLRRALEDLAEEGLVQVFIPSIGSQWIVGVVGVLQLDVLSSRAKSEYRIDIQFENVPFELARWLHCEDKTKLDNFIKSNSANIVHDREQRPVFLAKSSWELDYTVKNNQEISFFKTRELE
ncbi:MAG: EF-Tu/IF-2/RF-3 family GTPase, partial [Desulfobulbia bacterium]